MFKRDKFYQFILENGIVGLFEEEITLKSGRKSFWYINWRTALAEVEATLLVAGHIVQFACVDLGLEPDCFYGVPEGATKPALFATAEMWGTIPRLDTAPTALPMGRAKPKEHGSPADRYFIGAPKGRVVVVEDVTTTGGSLITTIKRLQELEDAEVVAAIGLTNRMAKTDNGQSVESAVALETGVKYFHMSSALDLLPHVVKKANPPKAVIDAIKEEFRMFGLERFELEPDH
jgi:orotate phosphoribosyltransferase